MWRQARQRASGCEPKARLPRATYHDAGARAAANANAAQPTTRRRPAQPRNTHERAATSDATNTTTTSTAAAKEPACSRGWRPTAAQCWWSTYGGALQPELGMVPHIPSTTNTALPP